MIPQPLHPAVVHFPIALSVILPFAALAAVLAIRRGTPVRMAWLPVLALGGLLSLSAWASLQTGEREEEAVERAVSESVIHEHEERAELFSTASVLLLGLIGAGLLPGARGTTLRSVATAGAFALLILTYRVGHSGGEMVYFHGAASAYAVSPSSSSQGSPDRAGGDRFEPDDDRDHR